MSMLQGLNLATFLAVPFFVVFRSDHAPSSGMHKDVWLLRSTKKTAKTEISLTPMALPY